jgi:hypothetical protein
MAVITPLKSDSVVSIDPNALMTLRCMLGLLSILTVIAFCERNFIATLRGLPQS